MNKQELIQIIEAAVSKAVKAEFHNLLNERKKTKVSTPLVENKVKSNTKPYTGTTTRATAPAPRPVASTKKVFSNNPMLNTILNETYVSGAKIDDPMGGIDHNDFSEYPTMDIHTNRIPSMIQQSNNNGGILPDDVPAELIPDSLKNVFNRDYTALVKKMNGDK